MSTPSRRRLMRDFRRLQEDPPQGVIGAPAEDDIMTWQAVIFGPDDTPWEGGTFKLQLVFSEEYPNKPPQVKFLTKLFHPNIYADGGICLDILSNQWSPIYDIGAILTSIQSLLTDPNPNSPANVEAAKLYQENRREYDRKVTEVVEALWQTEQLDNDNDEDEEEEIEESPMKKIKTDSSSDTSSSSTTAASSSSSSSSSSSQPTQQQHTPANSQEQS